MKWLKHIAFATMIILIGVLMVVSIIEKIYGTEVAMHYGYKAPWTIVLWAICAGCSTVYTTYEVFKSPRKNIAKRLWVWAFHGAFIVILTGALLTYLFDWGDTIAYIGTALLMLTMVLFFFVPNTKWAAYRKQISVIALLLVSSLTVVAAPKTLPRDEADRMGEKAIRYQGRICPLGAMAVDFTRKIYGRDHYEELTAEQVMLGWWLYPRQWAAEPIFRLKRSDRKSLGTEDKYVSYLYLLEAREKGLSMSRSLQEKMAVIPMLMREESLRVYPDYASPKLQYVNRFAHFGYTKPMAMTLAAVGLVLFLVICLHMGLGKTIPRWLRWSARIFSILNFLFLSLMLVLRWYLSGHIPMANGHETMQTMAWMALLLAIVLSCYNKSTMHLLSAGLILVSGMAMMVSMIAGNNPQLTDMVPALQSRWLSLHVSLVMMSYALLALLALINLVALVRPKMQFYALSQVILYPALFLLTAGIFIGAVWGSQSWGRYWGWDPKEVWALITMMIYALPVHPESLPWLCRKKCYHLYMVLAFLSVLVTYFGVNYFLGGLHSYV